MPPLHRDLDGIAFNFYPRNGQRTVQPYGLPLYDDTIQSRPL